MANKFCQSLGPLLYRGSIICPIFTSPEWSCKLTNPPFYTYVVFVFANGQTLLVFQRKRTNFLLQHEFVICYSRGNSIIQIIYYRKLLLIPPPPLPPVQMYKPLCPCVIIVSPPPHGSQLVRSCKKPLISLVLHNMQLHCFRDIVIVIFLCLLFLQSNTVRPCKGLHGTPKKPVSSLY